MYRLTHITSILIVQRFTLLIGFQVWEFPGLIVMSSNIYVVESASIVHEKLQFLRKVLLRMLEKGGKDFRCVNQTYKN